MRWSSPESLRQVARWKRQNSEYAKNLAAEYDRRADTMEARDAASRARSQKKAVAAKARNTATMVHKMFGQSGQFVHCRGSYWLRGPAPDGIIAYPRDEPSWLYRSSKLPDIQAVVLQIMSGNAIETLRSQRTKPWQKRNTICNACVVIEPLEEGGS